MNYLYLNEYKNLKSIKTFLSKEINQYFYSVNNNIKKGSEKINTSTLKVRISNIIKFEKFLYCAYPEIDSINVLCEKHIESFKDFCKKALKNSNKSVNIKLTSLKYFFDFLCKKNVIAYNYVLNVKTFKVLENDYPPILSTTQISLLFNELRKNKYGERDVLISKMILFTGKKISDIFNLTINDINLQKKIVTINDLTLTLTDSLYDSFSKYLSLRNDLDKNYSINLFLAKSGKKYSIRAYQLAFKAAILNIDTIEEKISPKNLKYTFIYNIVKIQDDIDIVKDITNQEKLEHYYQLANKKSNKKVIESIYKNPLNSII